ncbi:hypothetical protein CRM22_004187 [Opisthorchis felineus]|uniref:Phosphofurin acidic cluster sorting protein 2 n=1 Tax=Opisthorchis felineus TaxID=147828 RepID=A0A4S2M3W4_OPIFE|nr:hypothetical protein CRM22_004187 [Opisthorchis felineus]
MMSSVTSMKMSASWEAEKSSSNAVPRLCTLSLAQIILDRPIEPELSTTNFFVVVRMRGSARRVLRSPEISIGASKPAASDSTGTTPPSGANQSPTTAENQTGASSTPAGSLGYCSNSGMCVPIDFNCSIQYSHMLNRDANTLQILLQRRKKYKSKTMNLGYKTLAYCNVNLAQVLQKRIENRFLELYTDPNCTTHPVGRVEVQILSTVPLDKDLVNGKRKVLDEDEEYPLPDMYSEDSDHVEESDEDQVVENEEGGHRRQKKLVKAMSVGQKQIKQKLIGLLKKLKIGDPNEEDLDVAETSKLWDEIDLIATVSDVEEEDSDAEGAESISIHSTPKPTLRPFFATTGGSDETLGGDAGTKLLKRLHRQLLTQSETDTSPDSSYLRSVLPPINYPVRAAVPGIGVKVTAPARSTALRLRHQRDSAAGGGRLSGTRFAKRFTHIGRRSNVGDPGKQLANTAETSKVSDEPVTREYYPPTGVQYPAREDSLTENQDNSLPGNPSDLASSEDDSIPRGRHSPPAEVLTHQLFAQSFRSSLDVGSNPLIGDSVGTTQTRLPASAPRSPTLTSTPEAQRTHPSFRLLDDTRESSLSALEFDQLGSISLDKLTNVVFLVNLLEPGGKLASDLFSEHDLRLVPVTSYVETKQLFCRLVTEAQQHRRPPDGGDIIKVCILGGDALISFVLRAYVEQLSSRSTELASLFRFYIVPVTGLVRSKLDSSQCPSTDQRRSRATTTTSTSVDACTDVDYRRSFDFRGAGSLFVSTNVVASHLCKVDPSYCAIFWDMCADSADLEPRTSPDRRSEASALNNLSIIERACVYLTQSRNLLSMPIGACLLGTAPTSTAPPKLHKSSHSSEHPNLPSSWQTEPATSTSTDIPVSASGTTLTKVSSTGVPGLGEEMVMPFLLSVRLGSETNTNSPFGLTHQRSATGDLICTQQNPEMVGSVVSDPEASTGPAKRSLSPESRPHTTAISPQSHSTLYCSTPQTVTGRYWDLQIEYWVVHGSGQQSSSTGSTNPTSAAATIHPVSSTSAYPNAPPFSPGSSADTAPPRRVTMKSTCRGLLVTLGSHCGVPVTRSGDLTNLGLDVRPASTAYQPATPGQSQLLTLSVWTKEKKQKIMRIGRRGKEFGCKFEVIEHIQRLLCTGRGPVSGGHTSASVERGRDADSLAQTHPLLDVGGSTLDPANKTPTSIAALSLSTGPSTICPAVNHMLRISIDGVEWAGLKFFQITPTWRTHIKSFPISSMSVGRPCVAANSDPFISGAGQDVSFISIH